MRISIFAIEATPQLRRRVGRWLFRLLVVKADEVRIDPTIQKSPVQRLFCLPARVICLLQLREIGSAVIRIVRNLRTQCLDAVELLLRAHEFQERQPDVPPV